MPINLLKLPSLVGVSVVTELSDYQEIFLLSLCSRRSNNLVKKANIMVPKLAFKLEKCHGYSEFKIGVLIGDVINNWIRECIWLPVRSVVHVDKLALKETFTLKLGNNYEADANFDLRSIEGGKFLHRMECANGPKTMQKALQDHINSIFHYSDTNKLYLSMECEGSLPNVTNVQEIKIDPGNADPQFFFQIQNIQVMYKSGRDYIHNFVGRNMMLGCVFLTDQDLIQFLQRWISNEAYHNLETLSMFTGNETNADLIRQSVEFEEYDPYEPEKRPKEYVVDIPYAGSFPAMYPIRDQKFIEIKRITDGKRAFLDVGVHHFNFLVLKN